MTGGKLSPDDHPFLKTDNVKYSDWFGSGSAHEDYCDAVGEREAPDEVMQCATMLLLTWKDRAICVGYDGNEYHHSFEFVRNSTEEPT